MQPSHFSLSSRADLTGNISKFQASQLRGIAFASILSLVTHSECCRLSRSAIAPLSVLESDTKIHIKIHLSSTFTIFNITLTFVSN